MLIGDSGLPRFPSLPRLFQNAWHVTRVSFVGESRCARFSQIAAIATLVHAQPLDHAVSPPLRRIPSPLHHTYGIVYDELHIHSLHLTTSTPSAQYTMALCQQIPASVLLNQTNHVCEI
jgi:hypothetical protein